MAKTLTPTSKGYKAAKGIDTAKAKAGTDLFNLVPHYTDPSVAPHLTDFMGDYCECVSPGEGFFVCTGKAGHPEPYHMAYFSGAKPCNVEPWQDGISYKAGVPLTTFKVGDIVRKHSAKALLIGRVESIGTSNMGTPCVWVTILKNQGAGSIAGTTGVCWHTANCSPYAYDEELEKLLDEEEAIATATKYLSWVGKWVQRAPGHKLPTGIDNWSGLAKVTEWNEPDPGFAPHGYLWVDLYDNEGKVCMTQQWHADKTVLFNGVAPFNIAPGTVKPDVQAVYTSKMSAVEAVLLDYQEQIKAQIKADMDKFVYGSKWGKLDDWLTVWKHAVDVKWMPDYGNKGYTVEVIPSMMKDTTSFRLISPNGHVVVERVLTGQIMHKAKHATDAYDMLTL